MKRNDITSSDVSGPSVFSKYLVISKSIKSKPIGYSRKEKIYHEKENLLVLLLNYKPSAVVKTKRDYIIISNIPKLLVIDNSIKSKSVGYLRKEKSIIKKRIYLCCY
jgi:hypothetical protein